LKNGRYQEKSRAGPKCAYKPPVEIVSESLIFVSGNHDLGITSLRTGMEGTTIVAPRAAIREMSVRMIMTSHSSGCDFHSSEDSVVIMIPSAIMLVSGHGKMMKVSD
jgi:hypothetical protein